MDYKEKLEIDILDLTKKIFSKWHILVLCMTICGILAGAFGYYKSGREVYKESGESVSSSSSDISSSRNALTDSSAEFVESVARQYEIGYREYTNLIEQGKDSPILYESDLFSISNLYSISNFSYAVSPSYSDDADDCIISDSNNIIAAYKKELLSDDTCRLIADSASIDIDYVKDIVRIGVEGDSILSVTVYAGDKETAEKVMNTVTYNFDGVTAKIKGVYDYDISFINTFSSEGIDVYVQSIRYDYFQKLNNYKNQIAALASNMTAEEKSYFTALVNQAEVLDEIDNTEQETVIVRSFNKKYLLIGILAGLFIPVFLIALKYITSSKLHTADDLRCVFGLSVLGEVTGDGNNMDVICQGATIGASKLSAGSVYLMGASDDEVSVKNRNDIKDSIVAGEQLESVKAGTSAVNDAVSMKELSESDAVVLVERIDFSSYDDIAREIELCSKFGVKILGAVVVR